MNMKWIASADDFEHEYEMNMNMRLMNEYEWMNERMNEYEINYLYCWFSTWLWNELPLLVILNMNMKWITSADDSQHEYEMNHLCWWSKLKVWGVTVNMEGIPTAADNSRPSTTRKTWT